MQSRVLESSFQRNITVSSRTLPPDMIHGDLYLRAAVPIIVVLTGFDAFTESELRRLMGATPEDESEAERLRDKARLLANENFENEWKAVLMKMPYPPAAVVAISNGMVCQS